MRRVDVQLAMGILNAIVLLLGSRLVVTAVPIGSFADADWEVSPPEDGLMLVADRPIVLMGNGRSKRWSSPPPEEERLVRFSRNLLPEQEKMYQIRNVGDLPMFRFG